MKLVIGNKNYSSWSLRPWLLMHAHGIAFSEVNESLGQSNVGSRLAQYSGSRKVPVLIDNDIAIWDSLAICEYISETHLNHKGWPDSTSSRALARSVCAEMHAGFTEIRSQLPMNCRLNKKIKPIGQLATEVKRIEEIWTEYADITPDGKMYLFGSFSIADCFFAPVALRFRTYGIELTEKAHQYQQSLLSHPSVCEWVAQSSQETEILAVNEV